jgi:hypothetical protein
MENNAGSAELGDAPFDPIGSFITPYLFLHPPAPRNFFPSFCGRFIFFSSRSYSAEVA